VVWFTTKEWTKNQMYNSKEREPITDRGGVEGQGDASI